MLYDPRDYVQVQDWAARGWHLVDPVIPSADTGAFQDFVRGSAAEFSVAKDGYVLGRSAWFSDRSVWYLASSRPVILQDTGFSRHLPVGTGLLTFSNPGEAAEAVQRLGRDFSLHVRKAASIAREYFEAGRVLKHLLERV